MSDAPRQPAGEEPPRPAREEERRPAPEEERQATAGEQTRELPEGHHYLLEHEDEEWGLRSRVRSWLLLLGMVLLSLAWILPLYLFAPGIR